MKRLSVIFLLPFLLILFSCKGQNIHNQNTGYDSSVSLNEQTLSQLGVTSAEAQKSNEYQVLNYEDQIGMWFTYMDYQSILKDCQESDFKKNTAKRFKNAADMGVNTIYVHVRAFGDCYYYSDIFPKGEYYNTDYDPLEIMTEEAHKLGLSIHAWINPLRCQTEEQMRKLDDGFTIKKWYNDSEKNGSYIVNVNGTLYLNPAYQEVVDFISEGVSEIVENYSVDGIHIDDYFYPTTESSFDEAAFSLSENDALSEWRLENVNKMISQIYSTVKDIDQSILFGISPQGNINSDYSGQYADVKKWASESGFCDYIVPQVYFGFENEGCPFAETVQSWMEMNTCTDVKLVIGLCTYKIGNEDKWAGTGKNEWKENRDIVSRQISFCRENKLSCALYSYDSTFSENISDSERSSIAELLNGGDRQ